MAHDVLRAWALMKSTPGPITLGDACDEGDRRQRAANAEPPIDGAVHVDEDFRREAWAEAAAPPVDDEVARIRETLAQTWPRCEGHTPSAAEDWHLAGFADERVVQWLEVGVFTVGSAEALELAYIEPRDVMREVEDGVTLGLAYARGELTIAQVQAIVLAESGGCDGR